jgi:hypothetical protein
MYTRPHPQLSAIAMMLIIAATLAAEPQQCPADKAAERGYTAYDAFHKVMSPAWHTAWPAKDFGSLFKAGDEFVSHLKAVDLVVPIMKSKMRAAKFIEARKTFDELVAVYADACKKKDSAKVYELMPKVHDAFEASGALLGPIDFPHLEGILVTIDVILDKHVPDKNMTGIEGSTSTLIAKAKAFDSTMIPEDSKEYAVVVSSLIARIHEVSRKLAESASAKDMATYTTLGTDLRTEIRTFMAEWL